MASVKKKRVSEQRKKRGMMKIGKKWKRPNFFIAAWDGDNPPKDEDFLPYGYCHSFSFKREED